MVAEWKIQKLLKKEKTCCFNCSSLRESSLTSQLGSVVLKCIIFVVIFFQHVISLFWLNLISWTLRILLSYYQTNIVILLQIDILEGVTERLQHHLATIFCPDVLVAQTIFKAIQLFPLVSLKNVNAPRPELVVPIPIFCRLFRSDKNGDHQYWKWSNFHDVDYQKLITLAVIITSTIIITTFNVLWFYSICNNLFSGTTKSQRLL